MRRSTATDDVFIDTWGWLVLEDREDAHHSPVEDLRRRSVERGGRWVTTDYVLDETMTRLFARRPFAIAERFCAAIFRAIEDGSVVLEHITPERFHRAYKLRLRYHDKPRISFTDVTSFVVMQELRLGRVVTGDEHFNQVHLGFQVLPDL